MSERPRTSSTTITRPIEPLRLRPTRRRVVAAASLLCVLLGASLVAALTASAQTTSTPTSVAIRPPGGVTEPGTLTTGANGTFQVKVPFRQFAVHEVEFRDANNAVVDSASVTVTSVDGSTIDVTTAKRGHLVLTVSHHGGPNGAPSMGTGAYTPPAAPATTSSTTTSPTTTTTSPTTTTTRAPTTSSTDAAAGSGAEATSTERRSSTPGWIALIALGVALAATGVIAVARRRPEPADYAECDGVFGWSVTLKWEHSEPYSFLGITGASEDQAARNGNQLLRNRLTNERPAIDKYLRDYADGIACRPPCVKRVEFKEEPEHWDDPVARGDKVVCYVRKTMEVIVYCGAPDDEAPSDGG